MQYKFRHCALHFSCANQGHFIHADGVKILGNPSGRDLATILTTVGGTFDMEDVVRTTKTGAGNLNHPQKQSRQNQRINNAIGRIGDLGSTLHETPSGHPS